MIFENIPDGAYCVPDPDRPYILTYWRVEAGKLTAWPYGASYGPLKPPYTDPDCRQIQLENFKRLVTQHRQLIAMAIAEDPETAGARFVELTSYCRRCRKQHKVADLQALRDPYLSASAPGPRPVENHVDNPAVVLLAAAVVGGDVDARELLAGKDPGLVIGRLAWVIAQLAEGAVE